MFWYCWGLSTYEFGVLGGGFVGIVIAVWRLCIADKNRRQEQFRIGVELLEGSGHNYWKRVAGIAVLSNLAWKNGTYDQQVMRTFEAALRFPPRFGNNYGGHKKGQVDYSSRDTVEMVRAINRRSERHRRAYRIKFPKWAPFETDDRGKVRARRDHEACQDWIRATGSPPCF